MKTRFGQYNADGGEGYLRPVYFPSLATMESRTGDGRLLKADGGSIYGNTLPRPIMAQFQTMPGHMEAHVVGSLQEVEFHDDGNISGKGWLADIPEAHHLVTLMQTQSLFHNSVDLANIEVEAAWESDDPNNPGYWNLLMDFTRWGLAATTFVNVPAFSNAHGSLDAPSEVTASLKTDEPIEFTFETTVFTFEQAEDEEVTAALEAGAPEPFDAYHRPEPSVYTKHTIDAAGNVYGHLAPWGKCHDGVQNRCVIAPRPSSYSDFHQGTTLTDRGLIDTGVVFFLGGHPDKPLGNGDANKAYGGVENAWGKIRVVNGKLGPWYCGRVMTGLSPEALELARATGVSGHWRRDDTLAAIVSVNVRGYRVPGTDRTFDTDGVSFDAEGRRHDLVASLGHVEIPARPDAQTLAEQLIAMKQWTTMTPTTASTASNIIFNPTTDAVEAPAETESEIVDAWDSERLALELQLELDLDDA